MTCLDEYKESNFIAHLDANNLYGWAMSQYLPYGWFKWLNQKEIDRIDVNSIGDNSPIGYKLEVDLEYLDEFNYCIMIIH